MNIQVLTKLIAVSVAAFSFSPVLAAPLTTSAGADIDIDLNVANTVFAGIGPFASASGSAAPDYDNDQSLLNVGANADLTVAGPLTTELDVATVATSAAASGTATVPQATGSSQIDGLSFSFTNSIGNIDLATLFSFSADTITSTSMADGDGGLGVTGSSIIENASLGGTLLNGLNIDLGLFAAADPNTVLLDLLGISIILNEQITSGDGINSLGIETNAIHISLNDFLLGTQLLSGDIYVGRSSAFVDLGDAAEVPAPAAIGLLGLGLAGIAYARRRRT